MERKRKIKWQDRMVDVTELSFQTGGEHWNEYLVDDGSVIKLKTITSQILRVDGEYDNEGNPIYIIRSTNIVSISAPDKLRRPGTEE